MYYYRLCKTLLTFATIKHYKSKKILKNFTKLIIKSVGEKKNKTKLPRNSSVVNKIDI